MTERREGSTVAVVLAVVATVVLAAFAALVVLINRLTECGGDGGSYHALPGSPQVAYCDSNLDVLALTAPVPLVLVLVLGRNRRDMVVAAAAGLALACTPILAGYALPNA
jgi:hypothetical protein